MVERCIFVVCLDKSVKWSSNNNKENIENNNESSGGAEEQGLQLNGLNRIINNSNNNNNDSNNSNGGISGAGSSSNSSISSIGGSFDFKGVDSSTVRASHLMMHGGNSENNSGNRWFDKTMQFIISEDGDCGINYEHSPAEGIVVIELSEHLFRYM